MAKAMKGDGRSAKFVIEEAARAGFDDEWDIASALPPPKDTSRQSEALFDNLDLGRLSDVDKIELARLGQIIDLGGDFTALSTRDFERAKQIADKGRGKEITVSV